MDEKVYEEFPAAKHSWCQWMSASKAGGSDKVAMALRIIEEETRATGGLKPLFGLILENLPIIQEDLEDKDHYNRAPKRMTLSKYNLVDKYSDFRGWKKSRYLYMPKVLPTYVAVSGQKVDVVVSGGSTIVTKKDAKDQIDIKTMETVVTKHIRDNNEKCVIYKDATALLISEVAQMPIEKVQVKESSKIPVEDTCSAHVVVQFVQDIKIEAYTKSYVTKLKQSFGDSQAEIPITKRKGDKEDHVMLTLPKLAKTFMNRSKIVSDQDIAASLVQTMGLVIPDVSTSAKEKEFLKIMNSNLEERPKMIPFSQAWIEKLSPNKYLPYCPIYTGLKTTPWVLSYIDGFPLCTNKETFKLLLTMIIKFSKFYGLWIRGGLKPGVLQTYLESSLKMSNGYYGKALGINLALWSQPVRITSFKETSVINIKEDPNIFEESDEEYKEKYEDDYEKPDFSLDPRANMSDRDAFGPDSDNTKRHGANNKKLRDKVNKTENKSSSEESDHSKEEISESADLEKDYDISESLSEEENVKEREKIKKKSGSGSRSGKLKRNVLGSKDRKSSVEKIDTKRSNHDVKEDSNNKNRKANRKIKKVIYEQDDESTADKI
jgi:hypothetical protein